MSFELTDEEWALLAAVPVDDVVELAADLDVLIPAGEDGLDKRALLATCVPRMVERGRRDGLPLSKYDQPDVEALPADLRDALAQIQGLPRGSSIRRILRVGARAYKRLQKQRPANDPFAYMVPILLGPILRCARDA